MSADRNYQFDALGETYFLEETYVVTFQGVPYTRTRVRIVPSWLSKDRIVNVDEHSAHLIYDE